MLENGMDIKFIKSNFAYFTSIAVNHNQKVGGSNPPSATKEESRKHHACGSFCFST